MKKNSSIRQSPPTPTTTDFRWIASSVFYISWNVLIIGCCDWVPHQGQAVAVAVAAELLVDTPSSRSSVNNNKIITNNNPNKNLIVDQWKTKQYSNLHLTSLHQDDLSFLEKEEEDAMEKTHQTDILERIIFGKMTTPRRQLLQDYLEDDEDYYYDDEVDRAPPPKCIAPTSSSASSSSRADDNDTITTNTINTSSSSNSTSITNTTRNPPPPPPRTNVSGILLLQLVGRPTSVTDNETDILAQAILAVYQNLSQCDQPGVLRDYDKVEIIRDVFGFSTSFGSSNNIVNDDGMIMMGNETNSTMNRHRRHLQKLQLLHAQSQFVWNENDDKNHILWKTANDYFEWNLRHQKKKKNENFHSHYTRRFLQQQQNTTSGNNNTASMGGDGGDSTTNGNNTANTASSLIIPVTQPFNWLARLSGTCNGCALQATLFDDISRRRLVLDMDNENKKNNMLSPQIRGGAGGSGRNGGIRRRSLMDHNNETLDTTTEPPEICNCPGPKPGLFQMALNDTVRQLIEEGLLLSFDAIEETPELIRTSSTSCNEDDEEPMMETFSATVNLTLKACPSQFLVQDDEDENDDDNDEDGLSPLEVLALAYQKTFNELNLLNGGRNCDPYARRLIDVTAIYVPEELQSDENCTADNSPFLSFQLELEAECIGCNATLFELEEEEDPEESNGGTRLLRKLQQDPPGRNSDLFPFCFCPAGTPSRGITATELFQAFNVTLDIFEREGRGGNEFIVEVEEMMVLPSEAIAVCGNGIMELDEECDDGNTVDGDDCTNSCTIAKCGDGVQALDGSEECDDGNDIDTDECSNTCLEAVSTTGPPTSSLTDAQTQLPTDTPSTVPTSSPSAIPTSTSSTVPTSPPTTSPTTGPTFPPSHSPSGGPTGQPTPTPTDYPTRFPTTSPTRSPTAPPTATPSFSPTTSPTTSPTATPSSSPTTSPTPSPTTSPTSTPSFSPTKSPTPSPTTSPTPSPKPPPTPSPTASPTPAPTALPTDSPTIEATVSDCGFSDSCNELTEKICSVFGGVSLSTICNNGRCRTTLTCDINQVGSDCGYQSPVVCVSSSP